MPFQTTFSESVVRFPNWKAHFSRNKNNGQVAWMSVM
jgi:hypothetical protein